MKNHGLNWFLNCGIELMRNITIHLLQLNQQTNFLKTDIMLITCNYFM